MPSPKNKPNSSTKADLPDVAPSPDTTAPSSSAPSLTAKISQLDQKIEWFYGDDFSLDLASEKYKEALALTKEIESDLTNLKNQITIIDQDFTA